MKSKQGEVVDMEPHACLPIISFKAIFKIVITGEKWDTVSITWKEIVIKSIVSLHIQLQIAPMYQDQCHLPQWATWEG